MRVADRTNESLEISALTNRRFGKPYITIAEVMEELIDRRNAMGYTDPEPVATAESQPTTSRQALIDRFIGAHAEPTQEVPDENI